MIRVLLAVVLCVLSLILIAVIYLRDERRRRGRVDRREIVLEEEIQQNARDNYRLLELSVRTHQRVLDADAVLPSLSAGLRAELQYVVSQFHEGELPKEKDNT